MGDLETELIARNTLALVLKSFPAGRLVLWSPLIVGYQAWVLGRALRRGSWRAVLRGWSAALRAVAGDVAGAGGGAAADAGAAGAGGVVTGRIVRRRRTSTAAG